ncbi:MAG: hypothetical protein QM813_24285 [Verrucomicrobiota bacterium]
MFGFFVFLFGKPTGFPPVIPAITQADLEEIFVIKPLRRLFFAVTHFGKKKHSPYGPP